MTSDAGIAHFRSHAILFTMSNIKVKDIGTISGHTRVMWKSNLGVKGNAIRCPQML